jgi:hypothetical protein
LTLSFIAEQRHDVPFSCRKTLAQATNEFLALNRDGSFEHVTARPGRYQQ